jgi:hypothetical protein
MQSESDAAKPAIEQDISLPKNDIHDDREYEDALKR